MSVKQFRPVFVILGLQIFIFMSNNGGKKICFTVMPKHRKGEKERREMEGEIGLIKASCFLNVFVWIITVVFKVAGLAIICLS